MAMEHTPPAQPGGARRGTKVFLAALIAASIVAVALVATPEDGTAVVLEEAPAAPAVTPLISPSSKARAKIEKATVKADMEKHVKVTIAKARRAAAKALDVEKIANAKAKLKAKVGKAKAKGAKLIKQKIANEAHGKAVVAKSKNKLAMKIKKMFATATAIIPETRKKIKISAAKLHARLAAKLAKVNLAIKKKQEAMTLAAAAQMVKFKAKWKAQQAAAAAKRKALKAKLVAIRGKDAVEIKAKKGLDANEAKHKQIVSTKFDQTLKKRQTMENSDKAYAKAHDPFKDKVKRLSRRHGHGLRNSMRKQARQFHRHVGDQLAVISHQGRTEMRNVRELARQAYRAIRAYSDKKKKNTANIELQEDPQVKQVETQARNAEFKFNAAQDAADRAWGDTQRPVQEDAGPHF